MNTSMKLATSVLLAALALTAPVFAQTTSSTDASTQLSAVAAHGFWVTAAHPDITIAPGKNAGFSLNLLNATETPQRAALQINGLPDGWTYSLKSGGTDVSTSMVLPNQTDTLNLTITPAAGAARKSFDFNVATRFGSDTASLPLSISIADLSTGGTTLEPELPALRGSVQTNFQYKFKLTNGGGEDALFNLVADAPAGFTTTFKRGFGAEEITGVPVKAGATESVTLEVKLNAAVPAGDYPIRVATMAGSGETKQTATAELALQVTGSPALKLDGPQQRLSGEASAGQEATFPFTIQNTGGAPADSVKLEANAPSGWSVTFDPATLPRMAAGDTQDVTVTIKPTERAIAGDYMVTLRATATGVSESTQFRVTVNTSTLWGIIGVGIIGIAALILVAAVLRYGRR